MLRAAPAARLLTVAFVAMPIVSVPLMPLVPVASSVPVHRTRSVRLAAAVPSDDVDAEVEPVPAVRIRPRVCVAVVSMISDDALDPLVGLLGRLAVVRSVSSCSRGPCGEAEAVDSMMEAAHCAVRRENVGLAPSDLGRRQAVGVASSVAKILTLVASGARSMDVLSRHVLVVQADDVSVVAADVSLLVLVRALQSL
jgi:hypothetical protein